MQHLVASRDAPASHGDVLMDEISQRALAHVSAGVSSLATDAAHDIAWLAPTGAVAGYLARSPHASRLGATARGTLVGIGLGLFTSGTTWALTELQSR
jgi:hypothetical protein